MNARMMVLFCGVVSAVSLFAEGGRGVMLEWMGKQKVLNHHNDVPFHVLERKWGFGGVIDAALPADETGGRAVSMKPPSADGNMIIHGDNLIALQELVQRDRTQSSVK